MSIAPNVTLQNYLDYAQIRNVDSTDIQDLTENFQSVQDALLNISGDPNWQHFREEYRITTIQPYSTGTVDLTDGSTTLVGNATLWIAAGIDNTWVLKVDGEDTEYPIAVVGTETGITLKYAYVDKGRAALAAQSYKLIKRFYVLPNNFRSLIKLDRATASVNKVRELTPESMRERSQLSDDGGMPEWYSLLSVPGSTTKAIRFLPYPEGDFAFQYDLSYLRWPTALDLASPTANVDWPPEYRGVLEKAIEIEIFRRNRDRSAEEAAVAALNRVMPKFEAAANAHENHRLLPIGEDDADFYIDRINVDGSGA